MSLRTIRRTLSANGPAYNVERCDRWQQVQSRQWGKVERRRAQLEQSVARYLAQLDTADLQEPSEELAAKTAHLKEKLVTLESEMQRLAAMEKCLISRSR